jgi:hypothetical protein
VNSVCGNIPAVRTVAVVDSAILQEAGALCRCDVK